jgi:hypothetical protein
MANQEISAKDPISVAYDALRDQIDLAAKAMETHHAGFVALVMDSDKLFDLAHRTFSDERFKPFRYSGADVQKAFDNIGYPQTSTALPLKLADIAEAATWYLMDGDKRYDLAKQLLTFLPAFVAEKRFNEAHLILNTAYRMVSTPEKINFFLLEMFRFGMESFDAQLDSSRKAFLLGLGTDPLQVDKMSVDEAESWAVKLLSDPDKKARLLAFYAANPALKNHDAAEVWRLQHSALLLLISDDAGPLRLSKEEVKPWLTDGLIGKLQPLGAKARVAFADGKEADFNAIQEQITDIMIENAMDMAAKIYIPQRVKRLIEELKEYRRQLSKAGRMDEVNYAQGAILALSKDDKASVNTLLVTVCFESLRRAYADNF